MIVLIQCQFPSSDNCSKVTYNLYHWESWVKIIQALSELFLQLFKNKKGSNEHTHTHTHSQRHPNDKKCLDTQTCTQGEQRPGWCFQQVKECQRLSANHWGWVRGMGQIFSHSSQKETTLLTPWSWTASLKNGETINFY